MDKYIRIELKKVFPELELTEIPYDHPVYHQKFGHGLRGLRPLGCREVLESGCP
jgi:hypothetical protein